MKSNIPSRLHFWPMIVSLILLAGFLGFWIHEEYKRERSRIASERSFEALQNFVKQRQIVDSLNLSTEINSLPKNSNTNIDIIVDTLSSKNSSFDNGDNGSKKSVSNLLDGIASVVKRDTTPMIMVYADSTIKKSDIRFVKIDSEGTDESEIESEIILKNILPQILFSLFLLVSVGMAFWIIWRNMIRQRQLANLRNDFVSNITHELKTPLSTISVALEALDSFAAGDDPAKRKEYIDITRSEVGRLGLLIDKALNISLFEKGKFNYDIQLVNLVPEINWIKKTLQLQIESREIDFIFLKEGTDFQVYADRTHMVNVIHNLIENAIKYATPPTKIQLTLKEEIQSILITVKDNGPGIPKEYLPRIFDKFFRVPQGNEHNVKGHGLGLSYVAEVIKNMGGTIAVDSTFGSGTTFTIKMPKNQNLVN